ncbi:MAG: cyclodeaminase/cyclohydrolase family protein [Endomicrobia bacterium]|nr:cyclodeaminase/cyclohydrolase family protein [Endomicrobiia bacterium]
MQTYLLSSIEKYLNDLASNLPAPGGGSAAALVSSVGISCLLMVANFTVGKKGYEQVQEEIKKIIDELTQLKEKLKEYIDKDVEAYTEVSNAYKLPKNTPLDIEIRNKQIQSALEHAANVAFEVLELSHKSILYSEKLLNIGNKNLITDVACGTIFLLGGIQAAKYNVVINLKNITKHSYVLERKKQIKRIITDAKIITKKVLQKIKI